MPPRTARTIDVEKALAERIADERKARGLTYEALAEKMTGVGCDIHPSGIQKTEKSGRRITVEELVGYSLAFEIPVAELLDAELADAKLGQALAYARGVAADLKTAEVELVGAVGQLAALGADPLRGPERIQTLEALAADEEQVGPQLRKILTAALSGVEIQKVINQSEERGVNHHG